MDNKIVLEVTSKGEEELRGHTTILFGDMKRAFLMVDGVATFGEISKRAAPSLRYMLPELMQDLQSSGFIQDKARAGMAAKLVVPSKMSIPARAEASSAKPENQGGGELDFTSIMRAPTPAMMEEEAARAQAAKAKLEAQAEAARLKAQQEAQAHDDAERKKQQQAALQAKAQLDAALQARLQAEAAKLKAQQEIEAARLKAEHDAAKLREEAEHLKRQAQEEEVRALQQAEAIRLKAQQDAVRLRAEAEHLKQQMQIEEARVRAEHERRAKQEADAARLKAEQEAARAELDAAKAELEAKAQQARAKQEAEARIKAEQEAAKAHQAAQLAAQQEKTQPSVVHHAEDAAPIKLEAFSFDIPQSASAHVSAELHKETEHVGPQSTDAAGAAQASVARQAAKADAQADQEARLAADRASMEQLKREAEERNVAEAQAQKLAEAQAKAWAAAEQRAAEEARASAARAAHLAAQPAAEVAPASKKIAAPRAKRKPLPWGKLTAGLFVLALIALFVAPFVLPAQEYATRLEQILSAKLRQPVHIGHLDGRVLPTPRLVLSDIYIGEVKQIKVQQASLDFTVLTLFDTVRYIDSIELQSVQVSGAALQPVSEWLQQIASDQAFPVKRIVINQGTLDAGALQFTDIAGDVNFGALGVFTQAHLRANSGKYILDMESSSSNKIKVALAVSDNALPLLPNWHFLDLSAKGELSKDDLSVSEFDAHIAGGILHGSARLDWRSGWSAQGRFEAKAMTMQKINKLLEGDMDGSARFRMQAAKLADLTDSAILEGGFTARKGTINGMGIVETALLHSKEHLPGGRTHFDELSGTFAFADDSYHFREMQVTTEVLDATATLDVAKQQLSGKINAKLTMHQGVAPVDLLIGGAIDSPTLRAIR